MEKRAQYINAGFSSVGPGISPGLVRSAGGVAFCKQGNDLLIAMVKSYSGNWVLPKGEVEQGETDIETAIREIKEETGLCTEATRYLGQLSYSFKVSGRQYDKIVFHYLARVIGDLIVHESEEHSACDWVSIGLAINMARFPNEADMIARAQKILLNDEFLYGDDSVRRT